MVTITLLSYFVIYILYISNSNNFSNAQSIPPTCLPSSVCNNTILCSEHGHCYYDLMKYNSTNSNENLEKCICDTGYATGINDSISCCYAQKSQIMAFMMEFIVGFGLGHFYLGRLTYFFIKFSCYCLFCCSFYSIAVCFCYNNDELNQKTATPTQKFFNIVLITSCCLYILWQWLDAILIGINFYLDGNEMPLDPW